MSLNFVCYQSYIIVYNILLLWFFSSEIQQPPTYPSTAMPYNTMDALDKQSPAGFTTPYPATTNSCPPQPYPSNGGTAPYPTNGTNPATMGIVQPPPYQSTTADDNHELVK